MFQVTKFDIRFTLIVSYNIKIYGFLKMTQKLI